MRPEPQEPVVEIVRFVSLDERAAVMKGFRRRRVSNTGSECGNIKNNLSSKSENEQIQYRTQGVHEDDRHLPGPSP